MLSAFPFAQTLQQQRGGSTEHHAAAAMQKVGNSPNSNSSLARDSSVLVRDSGGAVKPPHELSERRKHTSGIARAAEIQQVLTLLASLVQKYKH